MQVSFPIRYIIIIIIIELKVCCGHSLYLHAGVCKVNFLLYEHFASHFRHLRLAMVGLWSVLAMINSSPTCVTVLDMLNYH